MPRSSTYRVAVAVAVLLPLIASGFLDPSPAQASAESVACQDYSVPVTAPVPGSFMAGQLCVPAGGSETVMVLVPGATYNSTYWNFPYDPSVYNFRLAMNNAGYATMTVDRLGTGASSKPLSTTPTSQVQALAIHEVIQALRTGQVGGQSFPTVVIGGHSLGSAITVFEAATYHDVNAVLLTGISHSLNTVPVAALIATLYPAPLDPKFAGTTLDVGYLTTEPGTRNQDFDAPDNPDQGVVTTDEATKDVVSAAELPDAIGEILLPLSRSINVPVFLVNGQDDNLFCGGTLLGGDDCSTAATLAAAEAPYFSPAAQLETYALPGAGHDVNLAPNTQLYQGVVLNWMASTV